MKKKKSQSAIEFVIVFAFILFILTVFMLIMGRNISDKTKSRQDLIIKDLVLEIQNEINLALESSDGYQREFEIPENINNREYNINITEEFIYLKTKDEKFAIAIPVANVAGDLLKGKNMVRKLNGEIHLN